MPDGSLPEPKPDAKPGALDLFLAFGRVGVTAFGGGLTGWIMQDMVRRRKWIGEEDFLAGLAMSQALPGVNVVNIAIWIGYRLGGSRSAVAAALGIIVPPLGMVAAFAAIYDWLIRFSWSHRAIEGAVAASIGLMLSMGVKVGRRNLRRLAPALVMGAVFVAVGVLRLPILPVIGVLAPVSVALAYRRELRDER